MGLADLGSKRKLGQGSGAVCLWGAVFLSHRNQNSYCSNRRTSVAVLNKFQFQTIKYNLHSRSPCHTSQPSQVIDLNLLACKCDRSAQRELGDEHDLAEFPPPGSLRGPVWPCNRQIFH
jgi:hypothetical protein